MGRVLIETLMERNYSVVTLVRDPNKLPFTHKNLKIIRGSVIETKDLSNALSGIDIVVSALGHGFRTKFPIQEASLTRLFPLMVKNKIKRFITVTGAGLKVKDDPHSLIADVSEKVFTIVDPYRISDAKKQQLLLEESQLNWTVLRTPIHNKNSHGEVSHVGFSQPPPWKTISRVAISKFIIECIEKNQYVKKAPIIW